MTTHPERYLWPSCVALVLCVAAMPATNWVVSAFRLPAGYGAEGDRRRANPIPPHVRAAVEELSADADGIWVEERVEGGSWVYDVNLIDDGRASVIHLSAQGNQIRPESPDSGSSLPLLALKQPGRDR